MKIRGTTITTPIARSAVADNTSVSNKPWSSKNTVDKLCPPFTESGSIVTCEPVEGYPLEVEWQTKNVVPYPYPCGERTENGITFTPNDDGSITINGIATENAQYRFYLSGERGRAWNVKPGADYTISLKKVSGSFSGSALLFVANYYKVNETSQTSWIFTRIDQKVTSSTMPCPEDCESIGAYLTVPKDTVCTDLVVTLQVELGTSQTAYEPYAETATITRCGKNLCTVDTVELVGNKTNKKIWSGSLSGPLVVSADFTGIEFVTPNASIIQCTVDGAIKYASPNNMKVKGYAITSGTLTEIRVINWCEGTGIVNIQLETGTTATDFEPCREPETFAIGEPITAIQGVNTIYADAGLVTVKGKADPVAIINKLTNAILSLGGNV